MDYKAECERLRAALAHAQSWEVSSKEALNYLVQQFDDEVFVCAICGNEEPTKECDSADYLRTFLAKNTPAPLAGSHDGCTSCSGLGYTDELFNLNEDYTKRVDCPDCGGTGKASKQITPSKLPEKQCQHDLCQPDPTIVIVDSWSKPGHMRVRCSVCNKHWMNPVAVAYDANQTKGEQ